MGRIPAAGPAGRSLVNLGMEYVHRQDIASLCHEALRHGATDEPGSAGDADPPVHQQFSLSPGQLHVGRGCSRQLCFQSRGVCPGVDVAGA